MKIMKTFNLTTAIVAVMGLFRLDRAHGNSMRVTSFLAGEQHDRTADNVVNGGTVFQASTERKLNKYAKKNAVVHGPTPPPSSLTGNCKHVTVRTNHPIAFVFRSGNSTVSVLLLLLLLGFHTRRCRCLGRGRGRGRRRRLRLLLRARVRFLRPRRSRPEGFLFLMGIFAGVITFGGCCCGRL